MSEDVDVYAALDAPAPVGEGNCTGDLVELPAVEGATSNRYQCALCHQIVVVGWEQLAESGVPTEHAPLEA